MTDINNIKTILEGNHELIGILKIVESLHLADSWLCAGTIRNYIWDILSNKKELTCYSDIDVIFYDPNITYEETLELEQDLIQRYPNYNWELKNQVYMHIHNPNTAVYTSSYDAISKFPETCTAIGARINKGNIELIANNFFKNDSELMSLFIKRVTHKKWQLRWPQLSIEDNNIM
ncbi:MAG: nucleotidyltransferase family protein [Vagococcus sp.]